MLFAGTRGEICSALLVIAWVCHLGLSEARETALFGELYLVQALKHAGGLNQDNNIPIQLRA